MSNKLLSALLISIAPAMSFATVVSFGTTGDKGPALDPKAEMAKKCKAAVDEVGEKSGGSTLSKEMIELELSGYRWNRDFKDIPCLKSKKFQYIKPSHVQYSEITEPDYILKKSREVKITKEKWLDDAAVEVTFVYIGTHDGKDTAITDRLVYVINFGERRLARGCASFQTEPENFVMRESCHR